MNRLKMRLSVCTSFEVVVSRSLCSLDVLTLSQDTPNLDLNLEDEVELTAPLATCCMFTTYLQLLNTDVLNHATRNDAVRVTYRNLSRIDFC